MDWILSVSYTHLFTAYDKLVYYQTYDITPYLKNGKNSFDIILADGWYAGHAQGIPGMNYLYGERPALIMQAEIGYADGKMQKLCSDDTFEAYSGPFLYADLFLSLIHIYVYKRQDWIYSSAERIMGTIQQ